MRSWMNSLWIQWYLVMFGHDLHEISKSHMQSRDPIDPKAADVSIWVKEKGFINLSDFATLHLFTSRLCWLLNIWRSYVEYNIQNKSGREPSSHLSELIVSSCNDVVVGKSNHVFIIRDPHAILSL